jgi:hypothetical protein
LSGRPALRYPNVPQTIGAVLSSRMATMVELDTVLGVEDLCNMLEVIAVDAYNDRPQE